MAIRVTQHPEFVLWLETLEDSARIRVLARASLLQDVGHSLGEPYVKSLKGTLLRELRTTIKGHEIRVLFAFSKDRSAAILLGGDKTGDWTGWYKENIPIAEARFVPLSEKNEL